MALQYKGLGLCQGVTGSRTFREHKRQGWERRAGWMWLRIIFENLFQIRMLLFRKLSFVLRAGDSLGRKHGPGITEPIRPIFFREPSFMVWKLHRPGVEGLAF